MSTKRDDILTAAITVFLEEGLKGARMERIADEASVSKRTLYKHFGDKNALLEAIHALVLTRLSNIAVPAFDATLDLKAQLRVALLAYIKQMATPDFVRHAQVLLGEFIRDPALAQKCYAEFRAIDAPLANVLSAAMQAGLLRQDTPLEACDVLLALFKTTIMDPLIYNMMPDAPTEQDFDQIATESVDAFLLLYGKTPDQTLKPLRDSQTDRLKVSMAQ